MGRKIERSEDLLRFLILAESMHEHYAFTRPSTNVQTAVRNSDYSIQVQFSLKLI